jgi:hypothetical protein
MRCLQVMDHSFYARGDCDPDFGIIQRVCVLAHLLRCSGRETSDTERERDTHTHSDRWKGGGGGSLRRGPPNQPTVIKRSDRQQRDTETESERARATCTHDRPRKGGGRERERRRRWMHCRTCNPNATSQEHQHPDRYMEGREAAVTTVPA